jgi:hypothetical protein
VINILTYFGRLTNCETVDKPEYSFLNSAFALLPRGQQEAQIRQRIGQLEYKFPNILLPLRANVVNTNTNSTFQHALLNAMSNGEVIHLIIIDMYKVANARVAKLLREVYSVEFYQELPQNIRQIPLIVVCSSRIRRSYAHEVKQLLGIAGRGVLHFMNYDQVAAELSEGSNLPSSLLKIARILLGYRDRLLADLEMCGFVLNFREGRVSAGPLFNEASFANSYRLTNLTKNLTKFVFMDKEAVRLSRAISDFESLLSVLCSARYREDASRKQAEAELQGFLVRHPEFLYQNSFTKCWAHPKIYRDDAAMKYGVPDFILKSTFTEMVEITDLKLPSDRLVLQHDARRLSMKLIDAVEQVIGYKHDLEANPEWTLHGEVRSVDSLSIVMGRFAGDSPTVHESIQEQYPTHNVKILGYNDLAELQRDVVEGLTFML